MYNNIEIIAEVKIKSPFGYKSKRTWDELFQIAEKVGDIISIHTDPRWGGSFKILERARSLTKKPILAKGIHATDSKIQQAIDVGADYVLVVGRIPATHLDKCLIEPLTLDQLKTIPENLKVVWNSRNLLDGSLKKETLEKAREIFKGWLCQASNIITIDDIKGDVNAVLIGTYLSEFSESLKQFRPTCLNYKI